MAPAFVMLNCVPISRVANRGWRRECGRMIAKFLRMFGWVLGSGIAGCLAAEWPEFRGATGDGHADGSTLPLHWSPSSNVVWKVAIPGQAWSSPVVSSGRIYLTTAVGDRGNAPSLHVIALEAKSGETIWDKQVLSPKKEVAMHGKNTHASPTPILRAGKVYVHFGHYGTACLDLDGKVLWRNESLAYPPVHGTGGSPVLVGNKLIFSCDGSSDPFVAALDADTGKLAWRFERKSSADRKFSFCTPTVIQLDGKTVVITPGSGVVNALDPETGRELWRVTYGNGYSVVPKPLYGNGLLYVATGFDRPSLLAIKPGGAGDTTSSNVVWTATKGVPNTPSLVLHGKEIYMVSDGGIASCLDALTGVVHWSERVGGNYSSSIVAAGDRIYFQNEEGVATIVRAGKVFEKLATNDLGERTLASYAADGRALLIRTSEHLWRIEEAGAVQ